MKKYILLLILSTFVLEAETNWVNAIDSTIENGRKEDIDFVGNEGWALDYSWYMYHTTDKGNSWTVDTNFNFYGNGRSIKMISEDIIIAGTAGFSYAISTDRGNTWNINEYNNQKATGICGYDMNIKGEIFGVGTYFRPGRMVISSDSGKSWRYKDFTQETSGLIDIRFIENGIGFMSGHNEIGGVVYRTTDHGESWKQVYQTDDDQHLPWKIDVTDGSKFIFIAVQSFKGEGSAVILKSSDKGLSWEEIPIPYSQIQGICFWDEMNGAIGGYSMPLLETSDGGSTWNEVEGTENSLVNRFIKLDNRTIAAGLGIYVKKKGQTGIISTNEYKEKYLNISYRIENNNLVIELDSRRDDNAIYSLFDANGRTHKSKEYLNLPKGKSELILDIDLNSGVYFFSIVNNLGLYSEKIVVSK